MGTCLLYHCPYIYLLLLRISTLDLFHLSSLTAVSQFLAACGLGCHGNPQWYSWTGLNEGSPRRARVEIVGFRALVFSFTSGTDPFFGQLNWAFMKALGTPLPPEGFPRRGRDGSLLWGPGARGREPSWAWRLTLRLVCGDR